MTSIFLHGPGFWGLRRARGAAQLSTSGGDLASQLEGVAPPVFDDRTLGATTGGCRTRSVAHKALVAERTGQIRSNGPSVSIEHVAFADTSNMIHLITLFSAAQFVEFKARFPGKEISPQTGAPFGMMREVLLSPIGLPCNPPPWGTLSAIDLNSRKILWQTPLGTTEAMNPLGLARRLGTPTLGGPLATSGGLVFIGAAMDDYLRAFDAKTGAELWTGRLPATGNSTPTTYEWQGRQYVVIAAGGHGETGSPANDALVAFALPRLGESTPSPWVSWTDKPGGRFKLHAGMVAVALVAALVLLTSWRGRRRRRAQAAR